MLKDKVAIITGSTSGIGLGIARGMAAQGAHVVLNGFGDAADIQKIRSDIESEFKVKTIHHAADMTKADEIADLVKTANDTFGRVDILVNNAGIQHVAPIDEFPPEKWEQIISINLVASFHTIRHVLPLMKKQGWGRIINIASAHALVASPFKSAYVAAKHGIAGLTKSVALETAKDNVTVNAICPGYVRTPLVDNQIADTARIRGISEEDVINNVILGVQPTKKFTTIEQVAGLAVFLCSSAADNMTGSMQSIDGGWTAH